MTNEQVASYIVMQKLLPLSANTFHVLKAQRNFAFAEESTLAPISKVSFPFSSPGCVQAGTHLFCVTCSRRLEVILKSILT